MTEYNVKSHFDNDFNAIKSVSGKFAVGKFAVKTKLNLSYKYIYFDKNS